VDEVRVLLHDGYDWSTTRKTIEAEIKNIRRRLYKFRQILASGQTPDESVEVTRTWLYESILIGLPEEELAEDAEALIAAIDNQLEHLEADTASIAPSGPATTRRGDSSRSSPRPAKRRRKLERSSRPEIEIKLGGLQVLHRIAVAGVRDRAKTIISLVNLEILDHIKTSTWKKFLAPMALARGQVAEADVKMIQVLLTKVIAEQNDKQQEEYRLKVA
jgi:autophagy-related protein 2